LHGPLREMLNDILSSEAISRRGLFDPIAVKQFIAADEAGHVDASYPLLALLCMELWCRRFIDQRVPS